MRLGPAAPFPPVRWLAPVIVVLLLAVALWLGFLLESIRADEYTLSFTKDGLPVSDTEIADNHARLVRDCAITIGLAAGAGVLWLVWQYRAQANMRAVVPGTRFGRAWALASWLIPGVNLIAPALAMDDLWRASDPNARGRGRSPPPPLVWLWWLLVLAGLALGGFALAPALAGQPTPDDLFLRDHRGVIASGIGIISAIAAAVLVAVVQGRLVSKEDRARFGSWQGWSEP
jgi:hypothetical protein